MLLPGMSSLMLMLVLLQMLGAGPGAGGGAEWWLVALGGSASLFDHLILLRCLHGACPCFTSFVVIVVRPTGVFWGPEDSATRTDIYEQSHSLAVLFWCAE